jgi:hypothetical protein
MTSSASAMIAAIALLAACLGLVALISRPKAMAAAAVVGTLGVKTAEQLTHVSAIGFFDEVATIACLVVFCLRRQHSGLPLRGIPGTVAFLLFGAIGIVGALLQGMPITLVAFATFLALKPVLFGLAVAQLDWQSSDLRTMAKIGAWIICVSAACAVINFAFPQRWAAIFQTEAYIDYRTALPSLIGPFVHPYDFGQILALMAIAVLAWRHLVAKSPWTLFLLVVSGLAVLSSFRRTAILGLASAAVFLLAKVRGASVALVLVLVVPIFLIVTWSSLSAFTAETINEYVSQAGSTARTVLTRDSVGVAQDHFPLGAGFGRFGSAQAAINYSPEYSKRGYPSIFGLGPQKGNNNFLTDTQWPAILGETGFFGVALWATGMWLVYRRFRVIFKSGRSPLVRWVGMVGMGWSIELLLASVGAPVYVAPPMFPLLFGLAGVAVALVEAEPDSPVADNQNATVPDCASPGTPMTVRRAPAGPAGVDRWLKLRSDELALA